MGLETIHDVHDISVYENKEFRDAGYSDMHEAGKAFMEAYSNHTPPVRKPVSREMAYEWVRKGLTHYEENLDTIRFALGNEEHRERVAQLRSVEEVVAEYTEHVGEDHVRTGHPVPDDHLGLGL